MKITTLKPLLRLACLAALLMAAASASAITYTLDMFNISGYTGPFGTAAVTLNDATHASITFTSGVVGGNIYLFGGEGSVDVNVNASSFTLGLVTGSNSGTGFTPGGWTDDGSGVVDGWGTFNQTIKSFDGFTHSSDSITFSLTNLSGTWATDADVLDANDKGKFVAAHIFVTTSPADANNGAIVTGFASGGPTSVPDGGSTVMLLGAAFSGLAMVRRFIKR